MPFSVARWSGDDGEPFVGARTSDEGRGTLVDRSSAPAPNGAKAQPKRQAETPAPAKPKASPTDRSAPRSDAKRGASEQPRAAKPRQPISDTVMGATAQRVPRTKRRANPVQRSQQTIQLNGSSTKPGKAARSGASSRPRLAQRRDPADVRDLDQTPKAKTKTLSAQRRELRALETMQGTSVPAVGRSGPKPIPQVRAKYYSDSANQRVRDDKGRVWRAEYARDAQAVVLTRVRTDGDEHERRIRTYRDDGTSRSSVTVDRLGGYRLNAREFDATGRLASTEERSAASTSRGAQRRSEVRDASGRMMRSDVSESTYGARNSRTISVSSGFKDGALRSRTSSTLTTEYGARRHSVATHERFRDGRLARTTSEDRTETSGGGVDATTKDRQLDSNGRVSRTSSVHVARPVEGADWTRSARERSYDRDASGAVVRLRNRRSDSSGQDLTIPAHERTRERTSRFSYNQLGQLVGERRIESDEKTQRKPDGTAPTTRT